MSFSSAFSTQFYGGGDYGKILRPSFFELISHEYIYNNLYDAIQHIYNVLCNYYPDLSSVAIKFDIYYLIASFIMEYLLLLSKNRSAGFADRIYSIERKYLGFNSNGFVSSNNFLNDRYNKHIALTCNKYKKSCNFANNFYSSIIINVLNFLFFWKKKKSEAEIVKHTYSQNEDVFRNKHKEKIKKTQSKRNEKNVKFLFLHFLELLKEKEKNKVYEKVIYIRILFAAFFSVAPPLIHKYLLLLYENYRSNLAVHSRNFSAFSISSSVRDSSLSSSSSSSIPHLFNSSFTSSYLTFLYIKIRMFVMRVFNFFCNMYRKMKRILTKITLIFPVAFVRIYPYVIVFNRLFSFIYKLLFFIDSNRYPYWSPFLHMMKIMYQKTPLEKSLFEREKQKVNYSIFSPSSSSSFFSSLSSPLPSLSLLKIFLNFFLSVKFFVSRFIDVFKKVCFNLLFVFFFFIRVLQWYYQFGDRLILPRYKSRIPPPPPPPSFNAILANDFFVSSTSSLLSSSSVRTSCLSSSVSPLPPITYIPLPQDPRLCPLCLKIRENPACIPTGYVFCLRCILQYIHENKKCPVTNIPIYSSSVRRLYEFSH